MSTRTANRIVAGGIFLISLTQFLITAQAGVAFWESGVFAAAAGSLQVSHPLGSPLYLLVGRVFHVILYTFFSGYQAWHITMVSVVASALTVMLLYLVLVNIIKVWYENIETKTDTVITYGAAAIGALSLSFSDAFWHNATESTPYAPALLCSAIALWLITQWYHRADEPGSVRYILLTAYVIGLSAGVHPLALLVIFPVVAIIYFRARRITIKNFFTLSGASAFCFIIGASVCITILLRSGSQPSISDSPAKESIDLRSSLPSNTAPATQHLLSDKGHAFFRYLCWQYIGRAGDVENAPAGFTMAVIPDAAKDTKQWWYGSTYDAIFPVRFWGIPFLLGLFGIFCHFKKDWRTGLTLLIGFVALGIGADFFRSTQIQSRETDHLYTGGFFIYSLWIGIGAYGILELIEEKLRDRATMQVGSLAGAFVLLAVAIDLNMGYGNWETHDRSNDFLPWDYAYNTLQSCGKDAILFTSGENDTYPLRYLQNAENIRRDVRIVNLPMQIKFEKQENDSTGSHLKQGEAQIVTLPVPHDTMAHYTDDPTLLLHPSIRFTYAPDMTADLNGKPGQYFSEKEQVVFDIVKTNANDGWKRPICWANTCSPDEYAGLGDYVRSSGLVATLVPVASRPRNGMDAIDRRTVEQNLMREPERIYEFPHNGFLFRNLNDPNIYRDETHRQISSLYRQAFLTLAMHYVYDEKPEPAKADSALNAMNAIIPHDIFPMSYELLYQTSTLYAAIGDTANFGMYSAYTIASCKELLEIPSLKSYIDPRFSPRELMIELYGKRGEYAGALALLNTMLEQARQYPQQQEFIRQKMYELQIKDLEKQKKYADAMNIAKNALTSITDTLDQSSLISRQNLEKLMIELRRKAGLSMQSDSTAH